MLTAKTIEFPNTQYVVDLERNVKSCTEYSIQCHRASPEMCQCIALGRSSESAEARTWSANTCSSH